MICESQTAEQEQQRVTVGPGNAYFISIRQVSSDAATLYMWPAAVAATAAAAAAHLLIKI